jgi:hypothetical protein
MFLARCLPAATPALRDLVEAAAVPFFAAFVAGFFLGATLVRFVFVTTLLTFGDFFFAMLFFLFVDFIHKEGGMDRFGGGVPPRSAEADVACKPNRIPPSLNTRGIQTEGWGDCKDAVGEVKFFLYPLPMHLLPHGRPIDWRAILFVSVISFMLSFLLLYAFTWFHSGFTVYQAQLIAGDPEVAKQYPTTHNILSNNEQLALARAALASFWWWVMVIVLSFFGTLYILRSFRL